MQWLNSLDRVLNQPSTAHVEEVRDDEAIQAERGGNDDKGEHVGDYHGENEDSGSQKLRRSIPEQTVIATRSDDKEVHPSRDDKGYLQLSPRDIVGSEIKSKIPTSDGSENVPKELSEDTVHQNQQESFAIEWAVDGSEQNKGSNSKETEDSIKGFPTTAVDIPAEESTIDSDDFTDFIIDRPLHSWNGSVPPDKPFDASLNCYGIVHVRVLKAQHLPCSAGSQVKVIVSLPPWKGKVRIEPTQAIIGPSECGVCTRWDQLSDAGLCSMINESSSPDSPLPSIKVELLSSPLGMGVVTLSMGSCELECNALLQSPGEWLSQWCQAGPTGLQLSPKAGTKPNHRIYPKIHVEAMFEPALTTQDPNRNADVDEDESQILADDNTVDLYLDASVRSRHLHSVSMRETLSQSQPTSVSSTLQLTSKAHLLRITNVWVPASCAVCGRWLVGRSSAYQCESCQVSCCTDCRLNFDLKIPCGSDLAKDIFEKSNRKQISVHKILSIVAPIREENAEILPTERSAINTEASMPTPNSIQRDHDAQSSMGFLRLEVIQGCIFDSPYRADTDISTVIQNVGGRVPQLGDYYIRVSSSSGKTITRTKTIQQTTTPHFETGEIMFEVNDHGMEYKLEIVESTTDKSIGSTLLMAYGLLQEQRDFCASQDRMALLQCFRGPRQFDKKRKVFLGLRRGFKSGFSPDFFPSNITANNNNTVNIRDKSRQEGELIGWVEATIGLEENCRDYYNFSKPLQCPPRSPQSASVTNFQLQIDRVGALIQDIKSAMESYKYIVGWENPALTGFAMIAYISSCLYFNAEYVGSLPLCFVGVFQIYSAWRRSAFNMRDHFIQKTVKAACKSIGSTVDYEIHRPLGMVAITAIQGKNLRSRDYGLVGKTACQVAWTSDELDTSNMSTTNNREGIVSEYAIGHTDGLYSADPDWSIKHYSPEAKRLLQLLAPVDDFHVLEEQAPLNSLRFPVLKPYEIMRSRAENNTKKAAGDLQETLEPWAQSSAAITFRIKFLDIINSLPGSEDSLGEVRIPFSKLVKNPELSGWFDIVSRGSSGVAAPTGEDPQKAQADLVTEKPQLFLSLKWSPPSELEPVLPLAREASFLVQEELSRSAKLSNKHKKDFWGSSIGAINSAFSMGGNIQMVQNTLCSILDAVDRFRNVLNFTDPFKSSAVFMATLSLWLLLITVPTRVFLLILGVAQFISSFVSRYWPQTRKQSRRRARPVSPPKEEANTSALTIWMSNFIQSLPTNEDLRKTYFWESQSRAAKEVEKHASIKRVSRLQKLWQASWYSRVKVRAHSLVARSPAGKNDNIGWLGAFAVLQGHRLLWWNEAEEFDRGDKPAGCLFLSGHSGLTNPSPLELRHIPRDELGRLVCLFGRGSVDQIRVTILTLDVQGKESLENAVLQVSLKDD